MNPLTEQTGPGKRPLSTTQLPVCLAIMMISTPAMLPIMVLWAATIRHMSASGAARMARVTPAISGPVQSTDHSHIFR